MGGIAVLRRGGGLLVASSVPVSMGVGYHGLGLGNRGGSRNESNAHPQQPEGHQDQGSYL